MVMRWSSEVRVEDLRNHSSEVVGTLKQLLAEGALMTADSKRPGFYEIENGNHIYYICIQANTGKVMLLATWPAARVLEEVHQAA